ncbi:hypothetical protein [Streptomyces sp. NPDC018610]|uniref:hypothetical protein n=1 Tax=Streptomyces sp. NPDC018610 TaxID=3365049 RepID=UPI0037B1949C
MRTKELPAGEPPPEAAGSEVTRLLCAALYARPARIGESGPWSRARLLQLVREVLRDPARAVPSYGFDLVPVLLHGVRARRRKLLRQAAVWVVLAAAVAWAPFSALGWLAALGLAWVVGSSGPIWAMLPLMGFWLFTVGSLEKNDDLHEVWVRSAQLPFLVAITMTLVYVVDGAVARSSRRRVTEDGGTAPPLPPAGSRDRVHVEWLGERQHATALPYDAEGRFIGAGRVARGAAEMRVPLRTAHAARSVVALRETEVLDSIAAALTAAGHGEDGGPGSTEETAPLPGFSVTRVLALPAGLWLEHSRSGAGEPETVSSLGRPERPYLRAQCISWQGQLVVTLFVHVALQAGELRLTLRPQVLAPLLPLPEPAGPGALEGLRGAAELAIAVWRNLRKTTVREDEPIAPEGPLSLRDLLSLPEVPDLHQKGDAARHLELMQAAVLRAVEALLERHGFATEALSDRRTVINSIQVLGDNNAGIQLAGGVTLTQVAQTAPLTPTQAPAPLPSTPVPASAPASASASTEGVNMTPGLPRMNPSPEPTPAPGSGLSIGGDNNGSAQNATGQSLSGITQVGVGQGSVPLDSLQTLAAQLTAFRADIERNASGLTDPDALRDHTAVLASVLPEPESEGFMPALRNAFRTLPGLVAGTAVERTGDAVVSAIRQLLG